MVEIRTQIEDYLELLKLKHTWNEREGIFELVFSERKDELPASPLPEEAEEHFRYTITVKPDEKWIQVFCDVYPLEKIPEAIRREVFLDLLACNRRYAEVCFDFDESREIIGTSQEMMVQGLNFDMFREEFLAVPWAVKKFWTEVASKHSLE
ncbi:MAG: hypothetical protein BAJATHORv1_30077 [Candidatus Thorarchaeota archaeon]|nr:MAG: hypothetical protein BAJATHORv1_30077 [Candidatus Thorarchaeota archaeon]